MAPRAEPWNATLSSHCVSTATHPQPCSHSDTDMLQPPSQIPQQSAKGQRFAPHILHVHLKPPEDYCSGEKSQLQPPSSHLDFVIQLFHLISGSFVPGNFTPGLESIILILLCLQLVCVARLGCVVGI